MAPSTRDVTPERQQLDDMDLLLGATAGAALVALALAGTYFALVWLAGQPAVFWGRVGAVGLVVLGFGVMAGGLAGVERAGRKRGAR